MRNPRSWRKIWILLLMPASLLVLKGCGTKDIAGGDPDAKDIQLTVRLENLDTPLLGQDIHILGPNMDFPQGKVTPGQTNVTTVITMRRDEEAIFQAGRNGTILKSITCKCTSACPSKGTTQVGTPKVTWSGSSAVLACVGW